MLYKVLGSAMFPKLFERADFNTGHSFKCSCGKTITVSIGDSKDSSKKSKKSNSTKDEYGKFGGNGRKKATAMYKFIEFASDRDTDDEDDCEEIVEQFKKTLKAFN